jgi:hypothetical protein
LDAAGLEAREERGMAGMTGRAWEAGEEREGSPGLLDFRPRGIRPRVFLLAFPWRLERERLEPSLLSPSSLSSLKSSSIPSELSKSIFLVSGLDLELRLVGFPPFGGDPPFFGVPGLGVFLPPPSSFPSTWVLSRLSVWEELALWRGLRLGAPGMKEQGLRASRAREERRGEDVDRELVEARRRVA